MNTIMPNDEDIIEKLKSLSSEKLRLVLSYIENIDKKSDKEIQEYLNQQKEIHSDIEMQEIRKMSGRSRGFELWHDEDENIYQEYLNGD